jgi:antitoxin YefM
MNTLKPSQARANLYRPIDQTAKSHEPIIISGKRNSAVLLSAEDWSAIQETLYLLAMPGMRESIKAGMVVSPLPKAQRRSSVDLAVTKKQLQVFACAIKDALCHACRKTNR